MTHKTQIWVTNNSLEELGIVSYEDLWHDITVILNHVCAYKPFYDETEEIDTTKTVVYMAVEEIVINTPYVDFNSLMQEFLNWNPCNSKSL